MITRRTRIQLAIFCLITLVGVSYVGAKYARLTSLFVPDHYTVVAHFASSGGIYQGGEVDYRGVRVGQVGKLVLTHSGVDVYLDIDNGWKDIPASNTRAQVADRSAVGEQYVDLQPASDAGPYLADGSQIPTSDTSVPLPTQTLLGDAATTVDSVDKNALRTTVHELGTAFVGTGPALQQILDTGTSFIQTANQNFDTTRNLIRDGNTVLRTQVHEQSAIRSFSRDLSLFSGTLAGDNKDLIRLIENGSAGADQLRTFLEENKVNLSELISEALTSGQVINAHLSGLKQVLVVYPYVVEGGFTVEARQPDTGLYDAHFGLILNNQGVCHAGYGGTRERSPSDRNTTNFNTSAHCAEPITAGNARGAQNAPRAVASYDESTHRLTWGDPASSSARPSTPAPAALGADNWKWLYLEPLTTGK